MNNTSEKSTPSILDRSRIVLAHGGGGQLTDQLISEVILPRLGNETLNELDDAALASLLGQGGEQLQNGSIEGC